MADSALFKILTLIYSSRQLKQFLKTLRGGLILGKWLHPRISVTKDRR